MVRVSHDVHHGNAEHRRARLLPRVEKKQDDDHIHFKDFLTGMKHHEQVPMNSTCLYLLMSVIASVGASLSCLKHLFSPLVVDLISRHQSQTAIMNANFYQPMKYLLAR